MDADIAIRVNDHGQSLVVPKLGRVVDVTGPTTFVLDNFKGCGRTKVVHTQSVGRLYVCIQTQDIASKDKVSDSQVRQGCLAGHGG